MNLANQSPNVRPAGTKISVQPLDGGRVMLRNDRATGLERDARIDRRTGSGSATSTGPRAIRKPDAPTGTQGTKGGTAAKPSVKSGERGEKAGTAKPTSTSGRNIRKKDGEPATAESSSVGYKSDPSVAGTSPRVGSTRTANGYPSSPTIRRPATSYGDGGRARSGSYSGPASRTSSGGTYSRPSSGRSSGTVSRPSSGRSSGARAGSSSSGRSSGGASRGSSSSGRFFRLRVPRIVLGRLAGEFRRQRPQEIATPFHRGASFPSAGLGRAPHFFALPSHTPLLVIDFFPRPG